MTLNTLHFTLYTAHCTLHIALCTVQTAHSTQHTTYCTLQTAHSTLHTSNCTQHTKHTAHCKLHTAHFNLLREPQPAYSKPTSYSNSFTQSFSAGSPNIRRTRNDDEYYGGSESRSSQQPNSSARSSSARRSGRGAALPGYQADTLTSIRRSKERSQTHTDSPTRCPHPPGPPGDALHRFRRTPSSRSSRPAPPGHSAGCRAGRAREWGEVRVSRTPSVKEMPPALVTSSNRRDSKKIEVPAAGQGLLARHGSVRAPALSRQEPPGLLRSFSLRRKGPEDFLHTSSMPCLAAPLTARDRNSNYSVGRASGGGQPAASTTPASAGLVLNSLAYQVSTLHCTAGQVVSFWYTLSSVPHVF